MNTASWKSAFAGFLVSVIPLLSVTIAFYASANLLADRITNTEYRNEFVDAFRLRAMDEAQFFSIVLVGYWLLAALCGKGRVAAVKWANYPLIVAGIFVVGLMSNNYFFWVETVCHQYPQSHTGFSLLMIDECPSSQTAFYGLQLATFLLVLHSLVYRIAYSRSKRVLDK
jgi:hypothetical protein